MKIAAIQMNSGTDKGENLATAERLIKDASRNGAKLVALPETFNYRYVDGVAREVGEPMLGPTMKRLRSLAWEQSIWILAGSFLEEAKSGKKYFNTSVLINPRGTLAAVYRKIHLFDSFVKSASVQESDVMRPGKEPVVARLGKFKAGLSVCYDLRFPELFRVYAAEGADLIFVPSSFTKKTGEAHWEVLLRARAIENQCYVVAPAQFGIGGGGVPTYGHSMIIGPWGEVLAEASGDREEVIYAEIDPKRIKEVREGLPALRHRRL